MHPKNTPPAAPHGLMPAAKTSKLILGKGLKWYRYIPLHTITYHYIPIPKTATGDSKSKTSGFIIALYNRPKNGSEFCWPPTKAAETKYATDII